MKKSRVCFLAVLIPLLSSHQLAYSSPQPSQTDAIFAKWDKPSSPGCALAVIKDGEVLYTRGYGMADLEHDVPISPNSVFYICSTSKQFVTMSILLLEEQGTLSLDADVRTFIPEIPEYARSITIRHLIHHTSGIRDYLTLWRLSGRDHLDHIPEDAVLQMICRQKELNFTPGTKFLYSNSCYFLLAVIVKRASGETLREFAHKHIFEPLGMNNSHFHDDNQHIIKHRAFGYTKTDDGGFGNLITRFDLVGSGGLYTTVEDLYLWDQNFYDNKLGKGSPELIERMLVNGKFSNGEEVDYAFALRHGTYRGAKTVAHAGALGGYKAQLLRFPEHKFSVVILSNLANFNPTARAFEVADMYLADHLEPKVAKADKSPKSKPEASDTLRLSKKQLAEFVGAYYSDELDVTYRISRQDRQLFLSVNNRPKIAMKPSGKDAFSKPFKLFFRRDEHERVVGFTIDAGRVTNLNFMRKSVEGTPIINQLQLWKKESSSKE